MSNPATDSLPIMRRAGYLPVPESPFTGPTSILRRLHDAPTVDVEEVATRLGFAPPVTAESVLAREPYVPPVAGDPDVEGSDEGLRAPRLLCKCGHPHGLHEELRRGDRCTRCRCQKFEPEAVLPTTAEQEHTRWVIVAGYAIVGVVGAFCGAGLLLVHEMVTGVLP